MRYLSEEWVAAQFAELPFETDDKAPGYDDCGGWGWDGPCGGCSRCMLAQFSYYIMKEKERARVFLQAGFDVADPALIQVGYHPGFGGYHDAYNCWCAKERPELSWPWTKSV